MTLLINKLERNIIRVSKMTHPNSLADPDHVITEKERFLKFYQRRNGKKNNTSSSNLKGAIPPKDKAE